MNAHEWAFIIGLGAVVLFAFSILGLMLWDMVSEQDWRWLTITLVYLAFGAVGVWGATGVGR